MMGSLAAAATIIGGVARAGATAGLLLAFMPSLLSTRWGTRAVEAAASRVLPGTVQVEALNLGWTHPISVRRLVIYEQGARRRGGGALGTGCCWLLGACAPANM